MSVDLPQIRNYGQYSNDNYGAHTLRVTVGRLTVWFSYETPVAFSIPGQGMVVRENDWGPMTGKHLNWIDGGDRGTRVPSDEFEKLWEIALKGEAQLTVETLQAM